MDSESLKDSKSCTCSCCCDSEIATLVWPRSVKRKFGQMFIGRDQSSPGLFSPSIARVEAEDERIALREALSTHQQTIQELYTELDEERNASASAANEAMSMIIRLQREKAEIQMEARQFKRFADEKMAHDQDELLALEDALYKREQLIQSLTCEVQAYKHRLLSIGYWEPEPEDAGGSVNGGSRDGAENIKTELDSPSYVYPPLKCNLNETPIFPDENEDQFEFEKYALGETPQARGHFQNLEYRISQLERNSSNNDMDSEFSGSRNFLEKAVVGQSPRLAMSPRRARHSRRFSHDNSSPFLGSFKEAGPSQDFTTESPRQGSRLKKMDDGSKVEDHSYSGKVDNVSDFGDDMSDRIYTIDSVQGVPYNGNGINGYSKLSIGTYDDYVTTPREFFARIDTGETDLPKLYTRLQALEADRESMRQAIISMRTDKAQLVLLKEIAQHLCKEKKPEKRPCVKKASFITISLMSVVKWVVSFLFWRKKAHHSKYTFGMSSNKVGLLLLLDKSTNMKRWRNLSRSS